MSITDECGTQSRDHGADSQQPPYRRRLTFESPNVQVEATLKQDHGNR